MSTCLVMLFVSMSSNVMAMTTPSMPSSTQETMISNMQLLGGQNGGSWSGMNGRGQGRGISDLEAMQAIMEIYNVPISTGINPAMTGRISGMNPVIEQRGLTRDGGTLDKRWSGRGAVVGTAAVDWGHNNGGIVRENGGIGYMNSGMGFPIAGERPMNAFMSGLVSRMNSGMGWQGRNGGMSGGIPGGNVGGNMGLGNGGRRSNVDKSIRTQATLNSQDEVLLRKAGAGCTQDWTHVNGGVDPFCISLLKMYPNRGM